jgi:hypothetical protein
LIAFYGTSNPKLQKALIDLCFFKDSSSIPLIDAAINKDQLSGEQIRMLPFVYTKSSLEGFSPFSKSRIKGMYKHTLCRNYALLAKAAQFKKELNAHGYKKVIFLKGIAQILSEQKNFGQRPMADIDVLVPGFSDDFEKAMSFIRNGGYTIGSSGLREVSIINDKKAEFDIHWYLAHGALKQLTINKIVDKAEIINYRGTEMTVPCFEHQLAHVIVHGVFAPTLTYDARWIMDAIDLLTKKQKIDTEVFLDFVKDFSLPSKVKYGIDLIIENIKSETLVNKKALREISKHIKPANNLLGYFYNQKPMPNVVFTDRKEQYSWVKSGICTHIIEPVIVAKYNRKSYLQSFALTLKFPPPSLFKAISLISIKIFSRMLHRLSVILKIPKKIFLPKKGF